MESSSWTKSNGHFLSTFSLSHNFFSSIPKELSCPVFSSFCQTCFLRSKFLLLKGLCSETFNDALTLSRHKLQNHFHQTQPVRTVKKKTLPDNTYLYRVNFPNSKFIHFIKLEPKIIILYLYKFLFSFHVRST